MSEIYKDGYYPKCDCFGEYGEKFEKEDLQEYNDIKCKCEFEFIDSYIYSCGLCNKTIDNKLHKSNVFDGFLYLHYCNYDFICNKCHNELVYGNYKYEQIYCKKVCISNKCRMGISCKSCDICGGSFSGKYTEYGMKYYGYESNGHTICGFCHKQFKEHKLKYSN